jgi:selenocysteine-specific elongation factor
MDTILSGTDEDLLIEIIQSLKTSTFAMLEQKSALPPEVVKELLVSLLGKEQIISLRSSPNPVKDIFASPAYWQDLKQNTIAALNNFHQNKPFKAGMNREDLRASLGLSQLIFDAALDKLAKEDQLVQKGSLVWAPDHEVILTDEQEKIVAPVLAVFQASPFSPPDISQVEASIGADLLEGLISSGRLIAVSDAVLFTPEALRAMQDWVRESITQDGEVSLAQLRDHFQTSRKYASATLEYFDSIGFTYRKGDVRGLR